MADNNKISSNRRKLYDVLTQHISNLGTFDEFNSRMDDESNRRKVYNIAQERISNTGTWDEFNARIYQAPEPVQPTQPVQQVREQTPAPTTTPQPVQQQPAPQQVVTPQPETPTAPKFNAGDTFTWKGKNYRLDGFREDGTARVYLDGDLTERKMTVEQLNEAQPFTAWKPTWQQRAAMQQRIDHSMRQFQATAEAGQQRLQNIMDYNGSGAALNGTPMKSRMVLNPATGKMEQAYITPYGDETTDQHVAEMAAREFRAEQFAATLPGRIQATRNHIADLKRRINKRASESLDEAQKFNEEKLNGPLGFLVHPQMIQASQQSDPELETLRLALSNAEKQLQQYLNVKDQQQNGDGFWRGFWRGTGQAIADVSAWDFGFTDLRHAMSTKFLADKVERGDELTESDQIALQDLALTNAVMSEFDLGRGYRWGDITGTSLSFMKDFALTGGFGGWSGVTARGTAAAASRLAPKWAAKAATRFAEREVLSRVTQRGFLQFAKNEGMAGVGALLKEQSLPWAVKALGTTADDLLVRAPMMVNTVQGMSTMANIINNKAGNATYNPETNQFTFEDGTTWSNAVWQAEADQVIENFSEMWGAHLPGLTNVTKAFGARNLTAAILRSTREGAGTVISTASNFLKRAGVNGYFGEVGEEYYGQAWRTMLGLDSAYDENGQNLFKSGQFHGDIWGGMALSVGLTGGGAMAVNSGLKYGGKAVDYYMIRNAVNRSDRRASTTLTAEVWDPMRTIIDATDNANIGALAEQVWNDQSMTDAQKTAVLNYMEAAMVMRGHNLRDFVTQQSEEEHEGRTAMADAYTEGINIESAEDRNRTRMSLNYEAEQLRNALNVAEDTNIDAMLAAMYGTDDINALVTSLYNDEAVSDRERTAIVDYLKAANRYNGMVQAVNDQIEADIAAQEEFVDSNSDSSDAENPVIRPATLKLDNEQVFIIGGNVQMLPDGTMVDIANSDDAIFIRRMDGSLDTIDAADILSISQPESTTSAKQRMADDTRSRRMAEFMNQINGTIAANPGDIVPVQVGEDIVEAQVVQNDGSNVTVAMPDGSQAVVPLMQIQDIANQQTESAYRAEIEASKTAEQPSEDFEPIIESEDETAGGENAPDESGLTLPRDKGLFPDEYEAPYSGQRLTASRYIENGAFNGMEYVNPITGAPDVIIAAVDDNSYVGYFREYDNDGNPTNEWSAKFENHSGDRSVHAGLMQTAAQMLPPGHELTEHTSVSTDGLRNLANQLRHGYTMQTNPDGTIKGRWVTINAASRNNDLGFDYAEREWELVHVTDEQFDTAKRNLAPLILELGIDPDAAIRMVSQPDGQKTIQVYHPTLLNTRNAEESTATIEATSTDDVSTFTPSTEFALNDNLVFGVGTDSRLVGAHARIVSIDNSDLTEPQYVVEYTTPNGDTRVMYKTAEDLTALQALVVPQAVEVEDSTVPKTEENVPNPIESTPNPTENPVSDTENVPKTEPTVENALSQIPTITDARGKAQPQWTAVEPGLAWDGLVERTADEEMAQTFADNKVDLAQKALDKAQKVKPKAIDDLEEFMESERQRKQAIAEAQAQIDAWKRIAAVAESRRREAERQRDAEIRAAAESRRQQEEAERARRYEEARILAEELNGVPEWTTDTPADARRRGHRRVAGAKVERQGEIPAVVGKEVDVNFAKGRTEKGRAVLIDASYAQPSHLQGYLNPLHFIPEAQPKDRNDGGVSTMAADDIAKDINPKQITATDVTAYVGAPTINRRGEVIQGNNRVDALRLMWERYPEQAAKYKQYLIDNAAAFGLNPADIEAMERPILANMLEVDDDTAIKLGQYTGESVESGGEVRLSPTHLTTQLGKDMPNFVNLLLRSNDEEATLAQLIDSNGLGVFKWLSEKGYITPTQYKTALDNRGNINAEAKNDLKDVLFESVFKGGAPTLKDMFSNLPVAAQNAILSTAFRDQQSPRGEKMLAEIQESIIAYNMMASTLAVAKNHEQAMNAMQMWKAQTQFDDISGEPVLPSKRFSNFALQLAAMYHKCTQRTLQGIFNGMFDLVQGTAQPTLFEPTPSNEPIPLTDAIKRVLEIEYQPVSNENNNGQIRDNDVVVNAPASEAGQPRGTADTDSGEQSSQGEESADRGAGASGRRQGDGTSQGNRGDSGASVRATAEINDKSMTADEAKVFIAVMEETADVANEITLTAENWDKLFGESGIVTTPVGEVKMGEHQFLKLMRQGREGKLGMIKPTLENPDAIVEDESSAIPGTVEERGTSYVFIKAFKKADGTRYYYFTSITVSKDGREVVVSNQEKSRNRILRLLTEGSVIWRAPKDAATASVEQQGLDYVQPMETETTTKGSGITPQSTSVSSEVYTVPAVSDGTATDTTEVNSGNGNVATAPAEDSSQTSDGKVNALYPNKQDSAVESSENEDAITPEQQALLDERNSSQYPAEREQSADKVTTFFPNNKNSQEESGQKADESAEKQTADAESFDQYVESLSDERLQELLSLWQTRLADTSGEWDMAQQYVDTYTAELKRRGLTEAAQSTLGAVVSVAEAETDTNPTEAQKEAGNYKKGHVQIGTFDVTIENPKGSIRRGTDVTGKEWQTEMQNTYGYIRGTESVDGDHIDVFLAENIDRWNGRRVFIADQYNEDGTFDEHKVMLGFNDKDDAALAYQSNYEDGWMRKRRIVVNSVIIEDFEKWIESSHRKTKPFADYAIARRGESTNVGETDVAEQNVTGQGYTIMSKPYTNKQNKTLDTYLVTFDRELSKEEKRAMAAAARADFKGWYDKETGGFMLRSKEDAEAFAQKYGTADDETIANEAPLSVDDMRPAEEPRAEIDDKTAEPGQDIPTASVDEQSFYAKGRTLTQSMQEIGQENNLGFDVAVGERYKYDGREIEIQAINGTNVRWFDKELNRTFEEPVGILEGVKPIEGAKPFNPSGNRLVTDEQYADYLARFKKKLGGQLNMGVDPEILQLGAMMAVYHIEKGARKFAAYVRAMIADLGEMSDKLPYQYLKGFYKNAHSMLEYEMPEVAEEMDSDEVVNKTDVATIVNGHTDAIATAEMVTAEQQAEEERIEAERKLKEERNKRRHNADGSTTTTINEGGTEIEMTEGDFIPGVQRTDKDVEWVGPTTEMEQKPKKGKKKSVSSQDNVASLFDNIDETTQNDNGQETDLEVGTGQAGGQRQQREQDTAMGGDESRSETTRPAGRTGDGRTGVDTGNNTGRGRGVSGVHEGAGAVAPADRRNTNNNRADRGQDYAPKSVDARIKANIRAIRLAQELTEAGVQATPEQMKVLRQFSGWGGLGSAFSNVEYSRQLRELLGEEAYEEANLSRHSAYYTPAHIIDAMWDIAANMGFRGGRVLEGSAGIGNILGLMPEAMSERSAIQAVEFDSTTGAILKLLYPDAQVDIKGFEKTQIENGSVDLAITNVPFSTDMHVHDDSGDSDLSRKFRHIHDFCIAKNIRKLREGGIGIFITSNGTLDSSDKLRAWIGNEGNCDVVGAFRLHNQTFGGTPTTSDIIVVRKRVNGKKSAHAIDITAVSALRTVEYDTGETRKVKGQEVPIVKTLPMIYNKYFVEHTENMGGEMQFNFERGETYRPEARSLFPSRDKDQAKMLQTWAQSFADMDFEQAEAANDFAVEYDKVGNEVKTGTMIIDSQGRLCVNRNGEARPLYATHRGKNETRTDAERIEDFNKKKINKRSRRECLEDYNRIKRALAAVLDYQTNNEGDEGLQPLLDELNRAYDTFVAKYRYFHNDKAGALSWLKNDVDYPSIVALESFSQRNDAQGNPIVKFGKTDIFTRRVVEKEAAPTPKNVRDGVLASMYLNGRIDVTYIADALGVTEDEAKQQIVESGLGFENPLTREVEVSYEYLSGNVREKLRQAREQNTDGRYTPNVSALERVIPMDIPAHLIEFTLGSSWIEPKLYEDFIKERTGVSVKLTNAGGTWAMTVTSGTINEKNRSAGVYSEMLKKTIFGHELMEAALRNVTLTVKQTYTKYVNGRKETETVTDKDATQVCANRVNEIRDDFKDWARGRMQADAEMAARVEAVYNERFNNSVPREIPDEFIPEHFGGQVTTMKGEPFSLRPHQAKAVIRGTMQSQILAHEVGTGKTYTLITTAMEMRRLGTARKPMIVVQNATVGQFVESAKALYPNAKVLTLEDADRDAEGRRNFYAKIKYNDWDMIVVPQSVFERIPDSAERRIKFIQDKIAEKEMVLEQMKAEDPDSILVKEAEREIEKAEAELADIADEARDKQATKDEKREAKAKHNAKAKAEEMLDRDVDDIEDFDQMGIDTLLVDEAHEYKHLGFETAMKRGVKGVDPSYSKKAQGVYLKCQAVMERSKGRNVIFATGTPISNTAAEIWTFMRYLMPADTMREYDIYYFDDFVRNFGNLQNMLEFSTSGKFKENNRFAGYVNLPELVRIWSTVADTVLTREAGAVQDKIPEVEGGKATDIFLPQTRALRSIMLYVKSELDRFENMSGKEKKRNSYIPLVCYGIAKAAAVDARLVQADAYDDPNSKTNEAVRQTLRSLKDSEGYHGTVAIFADNYRNKYSGFNLYEDIRGKLIQQGVPADQIVIMTSGMSIKKKLEIFDKVNRGEIRVIMGSTFTLGTGVNIQERLHTLIHVDAPNRPMDYTQRNGRILRQGNLHKEWGVPVRVLRFGVEDSLDVTAYQRLKTKGAIADSVMNGKELMSDSMNTRTLEEAEDVFGDITAQLSGSEYAMLKNQAEREVRKFTAKLKGWEADQTYIHNQKRTLSGQNQRAQEIINEAKAALATIERLFGDGTQPTIEVNGTTFANIEAMADLIKKHNAAIKEAEEGVKDGRLGDRVVKTLTIKVGGVPFVLTTSVSRNIGRSQQGDLFNQSQRDMTYSCEALGLTDQTVNGKRLLAALEDIMGNVITGKDYRERIEAQERVIERNNSQLAAMSERDGKPFEHEKELEGAKARLAEYTEKMKAEMAEKEAKYADIDATVEAASNVEYEADDEEDDSKESGKSDNNRYRIRESEPPRKTRIGYKVFFLGRNGELFPPMVANADRDSTPVGIWLDADGNEQFIIGGKDSVDAEYAHVEPWLRRYHVKAGGKGTQGGSGELAYRPGWHLGTIPYALQFMREDENGEKTLFPGDFVWAEVEYAADEDYQAESDERMWYDKDGKRRNAPLHSMGGLNHIPTNGSYTYRTNPNPETDPWIITGAMRVNRILKPSEVDKIVAEAGREPQRREPDARVTDALVERLNRQLQKKMETDREAMRGHGAELAARLHTPVRFIDNVEEITDSDMAVQHKKRTANGWYDTATGEVVIVLPNCDNVADVESTIFHEVVGHKGMREIVGEKNFGQFLCEVYDHASKTTRANINALIAKNGWDVELATEEYIAQLAEKGFEDMEAQEQSFWAKVKAKVLDFLNRLFEGRKLPKSISIGDNEIRYMLWRTYQQQTDGSLVGEAENVLMQQRLGVGRFRFSNGADYVERNRALARRYYESRVSTGAFQFTEAFQDSMLGLKRLYEAIEQGTGEKRRIEDIPSFENAYLAENALSSLNQAEMEAYERLVMKPLLDAMARLAPNENERLRLMEYMMAKHGLERNAYMRQEAANNNEDTDRDFAGLIGLTKEIDWQSAEIAAQQIVDDYEQSHSSPAIDALWARVNDATKATLQKVYECGILSQEQFDKISQMYEYYIPLRGWDETTSDDVYGYLASRDGAFSSPIKKAEGRSSKADDPIATIANMAENAIIQGNRNKMKQRFLNYVLNHPSDLVSVNKLWVKYDSVADEWIPVFADIDVNDTPAEVETKIANFEQRMEALRQAEPDKYKRGREASRVPYKVVKGNLREHQVIVKRGGEDYVLTINGNPRAAQAVNGMTNPDNEMKGGIGDALKGAQWVNRQLSNFYTTRNPDFVVSNFIRDAFYSNSMVWIKESPRYALKFHKNFAKVNPAMMLRLLALYRNNNLDLSNPTHRMFQEFMMNGGETGYTMQKDVEQQKKAIKKALKKSRRGRISAATAWEWLGEKLDDMNRGVENCARFAAYVTSREVGRDVQRAVFDAKEISVNFNKKGAGAKFLDKEKQSWAMRQMLRSSDFGRVGFVFWNAAIQGTVNFAKNAKRRPAKAMTAATALFMLGVLVAAMGCSGDDDDASAYFNQPDYVRRSNLMFKVGNQWVAIPLPVEYRAIYGMGELFTSVATGKEEMTDWELAKKMTAQMSQVMPLDFMEGGGGWHAFLPSSIKPVWEAYVSERGWTGLPLYKDTPYNKNLPEWTKAYSSANSQLVGLSAWANAVSGGDDYTKGWADFNPAKVEYLLKGYFGGYANVADKFIKTGETIFGDREYDPRSLLLVNRVIKSGDERTANKQLNADYFRYYEEYQDVHRRLTAYEHEQESGSDQYRILLEALKHTDEYRRHEVFDEYLPDIRDIQEDLKEASDREKVVALETELAQTKRLLVNALKAIGRDNSNS